MAETDRHLRELPPHDRVRVVHTRYGSGDYITNDCLMVMYISCGCGKIVIGNNNICKIDEGDAVLVAPNVPYRTICGDGVMRIETYCCWFDKDIVSECWDNLTEAFPGYNRFFIGADRYIRVHDTENHAMRDQFIRMIDEVLTKAPCGTDVILSRLRILLIDFFRAGLNNSASGVNRNYTADRAVRYINEQIYRHISLSDIAEDSNVSESMLCRAFKKHIGTTPMQYLTDIRIEKIKDILKNTDKPIAFVAELFQYQPDYIRKLFKQVTGMSMTEYRNKYHYKRVSPLDRDE